MAKKTKTIDTLDDLSFDQHNANKGTALGQTMVDQSIERYGAGRSIVADKHGVVIGGNKTLKAAREAGMDIEVVRTTGEKLIVHQRDDLDLNDGPDARMLAYTDNRASEAGLEWDADVILEDITAGLDLDTVFDANMLDDIGVELPGGDEVDEPEAQMDKAEELQEKWQVKDGDVWSIGEHRLMCGDNIKTRDYEVLLDSIKVGALVTDPPYGMNAVSKSGVLAAKYSGDIQGDDSNDTAIKSFIHNSWLEVPQIWWGANYYSNNLPDSSCWFVWDKNNGGSDQADAELAYTNMDGAVRVFKIASEKADRVHPTQKHPDLICWCIERTNTKGMIFDPFLGSGTTMVACEQLNRKCYGMEIEPKYCAVILERMSDMGLTPELVSNAREA